MNQPNNHIRDLIDRFLRKDASDDDLRELSEWLQKDSENLRLFDQHNERFQAERAFRNFDSGKSRAWQKLATETEITASASKSQLRDFSSSWIRVAASVSLLLVAVWGVWKFALQEKFGTAGNFAYHSDARNTLVVLPDSTSVWLNARSSIEYPADFSKKREVILKGEAFFDVKKKEKQNFIVMTKHLVIEVKGTRFNVEAYDENKEKATLEEGAIELTVKGDPQTYAMSPGEQITIDRIDKSITRTKVNPTNFTAWREDKIVFDNALLEDIITKIESRYHVKIVIDSVIAKRERLSMTIEQEPIEEILEMIQLSSRLNYRIEGETILIYE